MYIENPRKKIIRRQENFSSQSRPPYPPNRPLLIEEPEEELLIAEHSEETFLTWQANEFEIYEKDQKWYLGVIAFLVAVVGWAVYSNSPIMAITFILIGVVGYMYLQKEPRFLDFMITTDGIVAGREMYAYENLESFWIFYDPEGEKIISLKAKSHLAPFVYIPLGNEDPSQIRRALLDFLPEEKQDAGLWHIFERILKI